MFRFTIRDVLWLMVVVAVACGWGMERARLHDMRSYALALKQQLHTAW
jgi:hypothetical protein